MKTFLRLTACMAMLVASVMPMSAYNYTTVEGDPLGTKMYQLPNGLKIFMSVNKEQPRIQTYIAVRVGGKNDPAETTGLAHYFEHLMFKGSEQFGTTDYAAEKPLLDQIEQLFETYRHTTDEAQRKAIYHQIDSISYAASLIAIPNEYDKLMSAIGAKGTNAYTSYDVTCYVEDIPSNQIENWARIQADRFEHPILRGFHTELETIYEEKNMSLTKDSRKIAEAMLATLFPNHPYGTQTVLGTQENLKNPSITNVKNYHRQWYVPNNMAICLSGDFDPDNMVDIISKYFGHLKPNPNLPVLATTDEQPLTAPVDVDVVGPEAEFLYLAWRIPEAAHADMPALEVIESVLNNNYSGLIDLDINQRQTMLGAGAGIYGLADKGAFLLVGHPKQGQSLDEVRTLLLAEVDKLRKGEFADDLVPAVINNLKLDLQRALDSNDRRADMYVDAFVNGESWADAVASMHAIEKITKDDVVKIANRYLGADNYAALYKRQGNDTTVLKLSKPEITPIAMNRDASSKFLEDIRESQVQPIEPVFVDFDRDLTKLKTPNGTPVYYTRNTTNDLFSLTIRYNIGTGHDPMLRVAKNYIDMVGIPGMSAEEINSEFYKLGCTYYIMLGDDRTDVELSGLSENMPRALALLEKVLHNAVPDDTTYTALVDNIASSRQREKTNQGRNFSALFQYIQYGPHNPQTNQISIDSLKRTTPDTVLGALRNMCRYGHEIMYYGTDTEQQLLATLADNHTDSATPLTAPEGNPYPSVTTDETVIYVAPYEAKQLYMAQFSNRNDKYDPTLKAPIDVYNEYFGGSMNAIVFQEMRESRSLAYSAYAGYEEPSRASRPYIYFTQIATQNDKMSDAITAFDEIINDMPVSQASFDLAKDGIEARLRTKRTVKDNIARRYLRMRDLGLDHDPDIDTWNALPSITLDDIISFQKANVKGRTYHFAILADIDDIDLDALRKLGKVVILTPEQIFGY